MNSRPQSHLAALGSPESLSRTGRRGITPVPGRGRSLAARIGLFRSHEGAMGPGHAALRTTSGWAWCANRLRTFPCRGPWGTDLEWARCRIPADQVLGTLAPRGGGCADSRPPSPSDRRGSRDQRGSHGSPAHRERRAGRRGTPGITRRGISCTPKVGGASLHTMDRCQILGARDATHAQPPQRALGIPGVDGNLCRTRNGPASGRPPFDRPASLRTTRRDCPPGAACKPCLSGGYVPCCAWRCGRVPLPGCGRPCAVSCCGAWPPQGR